MILWTVQELEFLERLNRDGVAEASWDALWEIYKDDWMGKGQEWHWLDSYKWLVKQMNLRGIKCENPPIWAWYQWDEARKDPDLIGGGHGKIGVEHVCVEIEVPDELVLLSCFHTWGLVLNNWYCSLSEEECDKIDKLEDEGKLTKEMLQESWQRIFDFEAKRDPDWCGTCSTIQAVLPYVRKEWIRNVEHFVQQDIWSEEE